jgi:lipopolysaccharide export LptBFGC system permease protein LptF
MKLLTRYLFKDIWHYFMIFITIFIVVLLVNQIYSSREQFVKTTASIVDIATYLVCSIPADLSQMFPMICLMSTIFSYGLLAKNREILAMVASGISFRALARPALIFGLGLMAFTFWFTESVVPASQSTARSLGQGAIKGKKESVFTKRNNLFVKGAGNRFYYTQSYFSDRQEMLFPTILIGSKDGSGIAERIEADRAKLVQGARGRSWEFTGAEHWIFNADGSKIGRAHV